MKEDTLMALKNAVYETEGILELMQLRRDKMDELLPLLARRIDQVNILYAEVAAMERNDFSQDEEETAQEIAQPDTEPDMYAEPSPEAIPEPAQDLEPEMESEAVMEEEVTEDTEDTEDTLYSLEDADTSVPEEQERPQAPTRRPVFCLNDRFRFCKTLFNGDNASFDEAMNRLAAFRTMQEAEAYFIYQKGFDPEDEETREFMEIIAQYLQ